MNITIKKSDVKEYQNIEVREPKVSDFLEAERIAGKSEGVAFLTALTASICTFDGLRLTYEDVQGLPVSSFLELQKTLVSSGLLVSEEQPFGSSPKVE